MARVTYYRLSLFWDVKWSVKVWISFLISNCLGQTIYFKIFDQFLMLKELAIKKAKKAILTKSESALGDMCQVDHMILWCVQSYGSSLIYYWLWIIYPSITPTLTLLNVGMLLEYVNYSSLFFSFFFLHNGLYCS